MLTEIYLVRHAHSNYSAGTEETRGLSAKGLQDACAVTQLLVAQGIQVVFSSPYARAIQTVEGTAKALDLPLHLDERFRERVFARPDHITGDRAAIMEQGFDLPDVALPGGESNRDVEHRGIEAIADVLERFSGKRIAVGTHGGIMSIIMRHYDRQYGVTFLRNLPKPAIHQMTFQDDTFIGTQRIGNFG